MSTEDLTDSEKAKYKDVLKRQYEDLNYTIKDEVITDDKAVVTAEIEVYDLKKVMNDADKYLEENPNFEKALDLKKMIKESISKNNSKNLISECLRKIKRIFK